jgi:hypothetical protein
MTQQADRTPGADSDTTALRRKLLVGVALLLALASMYAGLLGAGPVIQWGLAIAALVLVVVGIASGGSRRSG